MIFVKKSRDNVRLCPSPNCYGRVRGKFKNVYITNHRDTNSIYIDQKWTKVGENDKQFQILGPQMLQMFSGIPTAKILIKNGQNWPTTHTYMHTLRHTFK